MTDRHEQALKSLSEISLEGRVAIVTGAARGLGRTMAFALCGRARTSCSSISTATRPTGSPTRRRASRTRARHGPCLRHPRPAPVPRRGRPHARGVRRLAHSREQRRARPHPCGARGANPLLPVSRDRPAGLGGRDRGERHRHVLHDPCGGPRADRGGLGTDHQHHDLARHHAAGRELALRRHESGHRGRNAYLGAGPEGNGRHGQFAHPRRGGGHRFRLRPRPRGDRANRAQAVAAAGDDRAAAVAVFVARPTPSPPRAMWASSGTIACRRRRPPAAPSSRRCCARRTATRGSVASP